MIKNLILLFNFIILLGCSSNNSLVSNPVSGEKKTPGLFSKDASKGISLDSILNPESSKNSESVANVNAYLWRASLNILSFAPLISTDALGGIIISDWYVNRKNKKNLKIFLNLLFLALLTAVCLEILLILLIADFVFAISAGV